MADLFGEDDLQEKPEEFVMLQEEQDLEEMKQATFVPHEWQNEKLKLNFSTPYSNNLELVKSTLDTITGIENRMEDIVELINESRKNIEIDGDINDQLNTDDYESLKESQEYKY